MTERSGSDINPDPHVIETMSDRTMRIDDRYQGFPGIALGGITGGYLARHIGREVEVEFTRPIQTGRDLEVVERDDRIELYADDELAATASSTTVDIDLPAAVSMDDAEVATRAYPGHHDHPYPSCFTCGTERSAGDGLRIFAGAVPDEPLLAAPWTPHENHADDGIVPVEYVWAAVDCPSIWAVMEAAPSESEDRVVTGRLAVRYDEPIRAHEPHVVTAWSLDRRSSIWPAGAAILDEDGSPRAVARHTLVVTDWGVPLGVARST